MRLFHRFIAPLLLCALTTTGPAAPALAGTGYTLVPSDKVALRIVEWQSGDARYASWEAVEGTYGVNQEGALTIPVAGTVVVQGLTVEAASKAIADALARNAGLETQPFVAAEITEYAPVFVTGDINTPGRYGFEPGMTVLKAVSIAGGLERLNDTNAAFFERNRIQSAGDYRSASSAWRGLLIRHARLQAEIQGEESFEIPSQLVDIPGIEADRDRELEFMRMRRVELDSRRASTDDLIALYEQQIRTLGEKLTSQNRQVDLAQKELGTVRGLRDRGLTDNSRQFTLERGLADAQSQLLDLEIALTEAKQSLEEGRRDRAELVNTRNAENQQELNTIALDLRKAEVEMQVAQLLGEQAGYRAATFDAMSRNAAGEGTRPRFTIVRADADGVQQSIAATDTTILRPHDLVTVTMEHAWTMTGAATPGPSSDIAAMKGR